MLRKLFLKLIEGKFPILNIKNAPNTVWVTDITYIWTVSRFVIRHISHAHELIFEYIETFYNTKRIHSHCDMSSPYDFEDKHVG